MDSYGNVFTQEFEKGANEVLKIAKMSGAQLVVLKSNSPSCGLGKIYDGTFTSTLIDGNGITANLLKENGFNTAIDTSGYGDSKYYDEILKYTDVVLLDIKHFDSPGYKALTGKSMDGFYEFASKLDSFKGKVWIRHVMVPGLTDNEAAINKLFHEIAPLAHIIEKIEVLPYHKMGLEKYEQLGMTYTMADVEEMNEDKAKHFENLLNSMLLEEKEEVLARKNII
ncbi:hypothetical protein SDC9_154692 [bioreactor metagenome]|uniref:[Formate-C-acetyltransferase]-activating enzyme n=1 Tax=bioreactor metagenome TaxID=1076179 RepID=A0A645F1N6_9ZZZZ